MVFPQPHDFSAIDFETASSRRASICQVGLTHVRRGKVDSTESWYVVPPTGLDDFQPMNVAIHGITAEDVARENGLSWEDSLARILSTCSGVPLVAHNVAFDKSVFEAACRESALDVPLLTWWDTLQLARVKFPGLPKHTLPVVAEHVGFDLQNHHDAASDSTAAAMIVLAVAAAQPSASLEELFGKPSKAKSRTFDPSFVTDSGYTRKVSELPPPNAEADPEGPLFGQHVVLTGALEGMTRGQAMDEMAARGAQVQNGVTKKTTMLVLAEWDTVPVNYNPALGSSKEKKAGDYNAKGQSIRFVGRRELESWLNRSAQSSALASLRSKIESAARHKTNLHPTADEPLEAPNASSGQRRLPAPMEPGRNAEDQRVVEGSESAHGQSVQPPLLPGPVPEAARKARAAPANNFHAPDSAREEHSTSLRGGEGEELPGPQTAASVEKRSPVASASCKQAPRGRSKGGMWGNVSLILGIVLAALNGLGLLVFLIPLVYGVSQGDGQLIFGSSFVLAFFIVFGGLGVLLIVMGSRSRAKNRSSSSDTDKRDRLQAASRHHG